MDCIKCGQEIPQERIVAIIEITGNYPDTCIGCANNDDDLIYSIQMTPELAEEKCSEAVYQMLMGCPDKFAEYGLKDTEEGLVCSTTLNTIQVCDIVSISDDLDVMPVQRPSDKVWLVLWLASNHSSRFIIVDTSVSEYFNATISDDYIVIERLPKIHSKLGTGHGKLGAGDRLFIKSVVDQWIKLNLG